jgi:hypothetical protein
LIDGCSHNDFGCRILSHDTVQVQGHLADVGILAEKTSEIASHRCNGIGPAPRKKVKQRFFFNGVAVPGNDFSIHQAQKGSGTVFPYTAQAPVAIINHAEMMAELALHLVVAQLYI